MDTPTPTMSLEEALTILNVRVDSSFDTVLDAKNKLIKQAGDSTKQREIEAAYDIILMNSMKRRLSGDVSTAIRFADVSRTKPASSSPKPPTAGGLPVNLPSLSRLQIPSPSSSSRGRGSAPSPANLLPSISPASGQLLVQESVVFSALAAWTLLDGFGTVSYGGASVPKVPGLQLALATAACAYFLSQQKRVSIGKAVGIALGAFVLGGIVGNGLEAYLRVDLVPLGPISNPATVVAEGSVLFTALAAFLLA